MQLRVYQDNTPGDHSVSTGPISHFKCPERRHRLGGRDRQRSEGEEDADASDDDDGPEGEPLQRVSLVLPQRQEPAIEQWPR